jgi:hypothetical protein
VSSARGAVHFWWLGKAPLDVGNEAALVAGMDTSREKKPIASINSPISVFPHPQSVISIWGGHDMSTWDRHKFRLESCYVKLGILLISSIEVPQPFVNDNESLST